MSDSSYISEPLLTFEDVFLSFPKEISLVDVLFRRDRAKNKKFWALQGISFSLFENDVLGVIGRNGSGKSTVSLVCTQVYRPDSGRVSVLGKVQLLALGVGFQNQMTGRENVFISGSLLGLSPDKISESMAEIEEFAEIGSFFDEPVRTYSSGMRSRLAFAIATAIRPDILILDEVMATGDQAFRDKALARVHNLRSLAKCAIIVSHNPGQLREICNKVMWIDYGRVIRFGDPVEVLNDYNQFCRDPEGWKANHSELFPV